MFFLNVLYNLRQYFVIAICKSREKS